MSKHTFAFVVAATLLIAGASAAFAVDDEVTPDNAANPDFTAVKALVDSGAFDQALPKLQELDKDSPNNPDVLNLMGFTYRKSALPDDMIFVSAVFEGTPDDPASVRARMEKLLADREASQPVKTRTGGSTFKNPPGLNAWKLIDAAGCRGMLHGPAQVSPMHCNFLINTGEATAADIEALGEEVRARVKAHSGVDLEWEIKRVGVA